MTPLVDATDQCSVIYV